MSRIADHRDHDRVSGAARRRSENGATRRGSRLLLTRHPGDAVRVGLAVGAIASTAVFVHRERVTVLEADLFRVANDLPGWLFPVLWVVMQLGNFIMVPVVAVVAAATRRFRLATEVGVTGTGVWLLAKVLKNLVVRGRPEELLGRVHIHGAAATGLGYPSGHAAVVAAIATLVIPYLGRRTRRTVILLAVLVGVARLYVGAHFPLDVVAGAALGWGTASAVHLVVGAPSGRPRPADVSRTLSGLGYPAVSMTALGLDGRRSALFEVGAPDGRRLFAKVVPRERRDADLLYRAWRWAARSRHVPEGRNRSGREALEHEALVAMQAARAGVRTPAVVGLGESRHGAGLLLQEWVDGRPLGVALPEADDLGARDLLGDIWGQVAILNHSRIAHRALNEEHLLVDGQGRAHVVGFADARIAGTADDLVADIAQVLVTTATAAGAEIAVSTGSARLGDTGVRAAIDLLGSRRGRRLAWTRAGGRAGGDGTVERLRAAAQMRPS